MSKSIMTPKEYEKKFHILKSIYEIGKLFTSTLEVDKLLNLVMEKVGDLVSAKNWSLLLLDEDARELFFEIVVGDNADKIKGQRIRVTEGIAGWVASNREPILIPDVSKDARFCSQIDTQSGFKTMSVIGTPLICRGKVLGVIELINKKIEQEFTEEDLETLNHLADYIAIAIDNARNFAKIEELTVKDDLTCLYNTRFFHEMLDREIRRAVRKKNELSVIFMDMDHFKEVNDTYGHLYGSKLLKEVALIIINSVRNIDIPIRYGGDEFVIILPETNKNQANFVANRILRNIRKNLFLSEEGININLTSSIGHATFPDDASDKDELVKKADNAMYEVKNSTRNDVRSAEQL